MAFPLVPVLAIAAVATAGGAAYYVAQKKKASEFPAELQPDLNLLLGSPIADTNLMQGVAQKLDGYGFTAQASAVRSRANQLTVARTNTVISGGSRHLGGRTLMGGGRSHLGGGRSHLGGGSSHLGAEGIAFGGGRSSLGGGRSHLGGGSAHLGGGRLILGGGGGSHRLGGSYPGAPRIGGYGMPMKARPGVAFGCQKPRMAVGSSYRFQDPRMTTFSGVRFGALSAAQISELRAMMRTAAAGGFPVSTTNPNAQPTGGGFSPNSSGMMAAAAAAAAQPTSAIKSAIYQPLAQQNRATLLSAMTAPQPVYVTTETNPLPSPDPSSVSYSTPDYSSQSLWGF